ncbi:hypothetical protein EDB83DRAFT_2593557 [Lactarius deliciosus]|nr:hypothetical protein EDB83DRAFT_2593557 [Lactarius deliciosus]
MAAEQAPRFELVSREDIPRTSATKPSHTKKREAGHIPCPPNAFILFCSSFIKSKSVPGNIKGNHSTLSKIIGIVWKTLQITNVFAVSLPLDLRQQSHQPLHLQIICYLSLYDSPSPEFARIR